MQIKAVLLIIVDFTGDGQLWIKLTGSTLTSRSVLACIDATFRVHAELDSSGLKQDSTSRLNGFVINCVSSRDPIDHLAKGL